MQSAVTQTVANGDNIDNVSGITIGNTSGNTSDNAGDNTHGNTNGNANGNTTGNTTGSASGNTSGNRGGNAARDIPVCVKTHCHRECVVVSGEIRSDVFDFAEYQRSRLHENSSYRIIQRNYEAYFCGFGIIFAGPDIKTPAYILEPPQVYVLGPLSVFFVRCRF